MQIERILTRVDLGPTHYWTFLVLSAVEVISGYHVVTISLVSPFLKQQWDLEKEVEDIPLFFYLGIIGGSFLAGMLANSLGRKHSLGIGLICQLTANSLFIVCDNFRTFLAILLFLGVGIGITLIVASTLCSQMLPQKVRGRALLFLNFIAVLGKFLSVLFSYSEAMKNWRKSQMYAFAVCALMLLTTIWRVPESTRFVLVKGRLLEGIKILQNLLHEQNKQKLTDKQKQALALWSQKSEKQSKIDNEATNIFKNETKKITLTLTINWFLINFMFYGQLFIMPFIFEHETQGALHFAEMICGEIPSILLTIKMIESESLGRKYSLSLFFLITALLNLGLIYYESILIIALARLTMKCIFQILYPLTTESYSTKDRSMGMAFCSGFGKIGSIIMPILIYPLFVMDSYLVFLAFMVLSLVGLYSSLHNKETLHTSIEEGILHHSHDEEIKLNVKQQFEIPHLYEKISNGSILAQPDKG